MKILQRNLNRSTFVVWEIKRNVSVVCVCSAPNCCDTEQRSASQSAGFGSEWDTLYNIRTMKFTGLGFRYNVHTLHELCTNVCKGKTQQRAGHLTYGNSQKEYFWNVAFCGNSNPTFNKIQICVAWRRGKVMRNASLGDFVVVRKCTYTNLDSTV